jgi:hypothetical protein
MVAYWSFSLHIDAFNLLTRNSKESISVSTLEYLKKRVKQELCEENMKITQGTSMRGTLQSFCVLAVAR